MTGRLLLKLIRLRMSFYVHVAGWLGGYSNGVPPDPIPNSAVKVVSADGTAS